MACIGSRLNEEGCSVVGMEVLSLTSVYALAPVCLYMYAWNGKMKYRRMGNENSGK